MENVLAICELLLITEVCITWLNPENEGLT